MHDSQKTMFILEILCYTKILWQIASQHLPFRSQYAYGID